ncbi:MAG TPA: D-alanyl-D-alanine carboxypeptidase, partial [Gemmatimonadales bacterium]|nr:D-alanyl-D-alanine carboxypeptidase [Gemmatimonadales bacterium]
MLGSALAACLAAAWVAPLPGQSLAKRMDRLLDAPPFDRHQWGVVVLDSTGKQLYGRNATRLFVPASNTKLFASAFATAVLPADWTVRTSV